MTLAERIEAARKALAAKKDSLVTLTKQLDETPDDDNVLTQVDALSAEIEKDAASLQTLEKAEAALAERAKQAGPAIVHSTKADTSELWAKKAVCVFLAHVLKGSPEAIAAERYKGNTALDAVLKTAVAPATTYTAGWAQELTRTDVQGFINLLVPVSVAAALSSRTLSLNFDGFTSVLVPRRGPRGATGANMGGAFVGEGGAIPLGQMSVTSAVLARYKMGVISTFTRELAQRSTPSIEAVIRQAILDDMSVELDKLFLSNAAAVVGVHPAGIANGVVPLTGAVGGGIDAVVADVKAAVGALLTANLGSRPVLLINTQDALSVGLMQSPLGDFVFKDDIAAGRLVGLDIVVSANVPKGTFYAVDGDTLATAFDSPEFDVNDFATVVEANSDTTAPTHATGAAGAIGTAGEVPRQGGIPVAGGTGAAMAGATARSLWQTWSIGVRSVLPVSWGVVNPGGVVITTGLTW